MLRKSTNVDDISIEIDVFKGIAFDQITISDDRFALIALSNGNEEDGPLRRNEIHTDTGWPSVVRNEIIDIGDGEISTPGDDELGVVIATSIQTWIRLAAGGIEHALPELVLREL